MKGSRMGKSQARNLRLVGSRHGLWRVVRGRRVFGLPPSVAMSVGILAVLLVAAIAAPFLAPQDPVSASLGDRMMPPMWLDGGDAAHPLGTDNFGRDVLSRLVYGARISLSVAGLTMVFAGIVGAITGIISGYVGGVVDAAIMRTVDVLLAVPTVLIAIAIAVALGPSFNNLVIVISALLWPKIARTIRGEALVIKVQDYVEYAQAVGVSAWRVMARHLLPNVTHTLLVIVTLEVGQVILLEAALGFLGAGIPPPEPSWGVSVSDGRETIGTGWWVGLFPGLAIVLTVLTFNTLGDWLRDHLDPRLKER